MKLAILDDYQRIALAVADWSLLGETVSIDTFDYHLGDEDNVVKALSTFEIVVAMRERTAFPSAVLARLPKLRLLVTTGMRNLAIDMTAARTRGVDVCGTQMLGYPAAEHTWALILALVKQLPLENDTMHRGGWQAAMSSGLKHKTLGILGLGKLGVQVAHVARAFGMNVQAWSENLTQARCEEYDVTWVARDTLLSTSDIVSIHLVLSERTHGLLGPDELALMKPTAYLVNTSRGPIVDEDALVKALENGTIAGAGLDVYAIEPLPSEHPLRAAPNALLTGHTGYVMRENYAKGYGQAIDNIIAWLAGSPTRLLN